VCGQFFPEGTVLSVPSFTIHRDAGVWGEDVEAFRPERWFEGDKEMINKTFNPFSYGPRSVKASFLFFLANFCNRACVGRNLAFLELQIIVGSIMKRFHFVLEDPDAPVRRRTIFILISGINSRIYSSKPGRAS
jgi:benzoate 4-monooxygenase